MDESRRQNGKNAKPRESSKNAARAQVGCAPCWVTLATATRFVGRIATPIKNVVLLLQTTQDWYPWRYAADREGLRPY